MSDDDALKRRYKEFLDLMPLTLAIGGLPPSEGKAHFTTDQLELRSQVLVNAFKMARKTVREAIREE